MENFHGRIEDEFYDLEDLPTLSTLLNKAYTYMLYFNLERVNLNLKRAPFEMVRERNHIKDPNFMDFPPVVLDYLPLEAPDLLSGNDVSDDLKFTVLLSSPVGSCIGCVLDAQYRRAHLCIAL